MKKIWGIVGGFLISGAVLGFSLQTDNLTFKELVTLMLERTGKNYLLTHELPEHLVSVNFKGVNLLEALSNLLKAEQFQLQITDQKITVLPPGRHSLSTKVFVLNYADPNDLVTLIKEAHLISPQGSIIPDLKRHLLIVQDFPERIEELGKQLIKLDTLVKQLLIEVKIVSIDKNYTKQFGLALNVQERLASLPNALIVNLAKLTPQWLNYQLNALEKSGHGQVISQPVLFTQNHQTASIETGAEVPYLERNRKGDASISFKKAVLSLNVTPEITAQQQINLSIQLNQDKVEEMVRDIQAPTINTRKIKTQVRLGNEETAILGGIYEWYEQGYQNTLPGISKVPLLNWLVSDRHKKIEQRELLIFVTVKILD